MTISLGYANWKGAGFGASVTTTGGTTQSTASTFIVAACIGNGDGVSISSIADNKSNTYILANQYGFAFGSAELWLYYCINGAGGSGHTCTATWASGVNFGGIGFAEFKNVGAGTLDLAPSGAGGSSSVTSQAAPSITTSVANELVVNVFSTYQANTQTITDSGSGFSIATDQTANTSIDGAITWAVPASTGAYGDTLGVTVADFIGALALSIKPGGITPPNFSGFNLASGIAALGWIIRRRNKLASEKNAHLRRYERSAGGILVPDTKIAA